VELHRSRVSAGDGEAISSLNNALDIHDADVHSAIVNRYAFQNTATTTTLAVATVGDGTEYQITVASSVGFSVNDRIFIDTSIDEVTLPIIKAIAGNVITLDRRLDKAHAIGDSVTKVITNMASQAGTLASPQSYKLAPMSGEVWHITRLLLSITHNTAGDLGLFGDLAALTNGVVLRVYVSGQFGTLTNWKTSADIKDDMYDVDFDSRSSGGGTYGTSGRGTFKNAGSIVRLDGTLGDYIEILVQDDITGLLSFQVKFQGHPEQA